MDASGSARSRVRRDPADGSTTSVDRRDLDSRSKTTAVTLASAAMRNPFANLHRYWRGDGEFLRRRAELLAQPPIPYLWLFGKTGSGKTSIIHSLTGAENAVIGKGFRPQTPAAQLFSFPDDETPIVQFLDTRGIGEA